MRLAYRGRLLAVKMADSPLNNFLHDWQEHQHNSESGMPSKLLAAVQESRLWSSGVSSGQLQFGPSNISSRSVSSDAVAETSGLG